MVTCKGRYRKVTKGWARAPMGRPPVARPGQTGGSTGPGRSDPPGGPLPLAAQETRSYFRHPDRPIPMPMRNPFPSPRSLRLAACLAALFAVPALPDSTSNHGPAPAPAPPPRLESPGQVVPLGLGFHVRALLGTSFGFAWVGSRVRRAANSSRRSRPAIGAAPASPICVATMPPGGSLPRL